MDPWLFGLEDLESKLLILDPSILSKQKISVEIHPLVYKHTILRNCIKLKFHTHFCPPNKEKFATSCLTICLSTFRSGPGSEVPDVRFKNQDTLLIISLLEIGVDFTRGGQLSIKIIPLLLKRPFFRFWAS